MSTTSKDSAKTIGLTINVVLVIGLAFWMLTSCGRQRENRDYEMKGRGMLEAKGFYVIPSGAGSDYYYETMFGGWGPEDYEIFYKRLKIYETGRKALFDRGLNAKQVDKVSEFEIDDAFEAANSRNAFDRLARKYD